MPVCLHAWNWFSANSTTQCIGGLRCGQPWRQSLTFLCSASAPWPQYFILFPTKSRENGFICLCVFLLPKKYRIACFCLCWYRTDSGWLELIMIRSNYKYYGSPVVRERKEKITKGQPCHLWQLNLHFLKKNLNMLICALCIPACTSYLKRTHRCSLWLMWWLLLLVLQHRGISWFSDIFLYL